MLVDVYPPTGTIFPGETYRLRIEPFPTANVFRNAVLPLVSP
jgi:hypothetical protein